MADSMRAVGLFAGIGGLEKGMESAGMSTVGLCEIEPAAQAVLKHGWPNVPLWNDVRTVKSLPQAEILTAGFPCQDLSQAGRKAGIRGAQSSLVEHVIRLMSRRGAPHTLLLENVSYMLRLDNGRGMAFLTTALEELGLRWAYRVVDARAFGVPQRRQRVLMVASRKLDPTAVLLGDDEGRDFDPADSIGEVDAGSMYGFYWTEGLRGLGWARQAVPTVKGGSALGIPSPPAIWCPSTGFIGTPNIIDAERLQGFRPGWTQPATDSGFREGARWKLVGNAVCVPMAKWIARRLVNPNDANVQGTAIKASKGWPNAAYGSKGERFAVDVSMFPLAPEYELTTFLSHDLKPLSLKATLGFHDRALRGKLRFADGFLDAVASHAERMSEVAA